MQAQKYNILGRILWEENVVLHEMGNEKFAA